MPDMTFSNPQGQQITVNSPDGSTPSEGELDQLFAQAHSGEGDNDEEPEQISDIRAAQPQQAPEKNNSNSTGNPITDISGDIARGFLNSGAGTIDKINGAVKLLKTVTNYDVGSEGLTQVSNKLKQLASQQPQSSNPIISGIGQFAGSTPDALAEFAGTGGGVGFIARSAALQAAQEFNKNQSATSLIKGTLVGGTIGAALDKMPAAIEGAGNLIKKWGQTSGKTYLQAVTGATDKEAQEIIDNLPNMNIDPKSKIEDYDEAKANASGEISTLRDNNNSLIQQQKDQYNKNYQAAKIASDDAVNSLTENNRDVIDDLRTNQAQNKENLSASNSTNMMAATDAATQKLADAAINNTVAVTKAKNALDNTLVNTFDTASKKLDAMVKGVSDNVSTAHTALENNNLDYVPTPIIKKEIDAALGGNNKYFRSLSNKPQSTADVTLGNGIKLSDLPKEAQEQYRQQAQRQGQTNLGQVAKSGNTIDSLIAQPGTGTNAVAKSIDLINDTKNSLVNEFSKTGKTSLAAIEAHSNSLEGAIDKGFSGQSVPKGLVVTMARIKQAINPTKLFEKYPQELSHLEPLAKANKSYSGQIDGLRNALNLYKDNVDGTIDPKKVFNALDKNDTGYIAKLRQADDSLPPQDRIFDKVNKAYGDYKKVEESEKITLAKNEKQISQQRIALSKKFDDMKKQLNIEQRKQLSDAIKETRSNKRAYTQQQAKALEDLHSRQRQALSMLQDQKDKELNSLQEAVNGRLHSLHLLHMTRGTRASATGNARIFQNVANYRSIDGMTTLNPLKMVQGSVISKFASPQGAASIVKGALKAPESLEVLKKISSNKILRNLLANKLSGR